VDDVTLSPGAMERSYQAFVGGGTGEYLGMQVGGYGGFKKYYFHNDERGSLLALSDDTGATLNGYTYDGFGNYLTSDNNDYPIEYGINGKFCDIGLRRSKFDETVADYDTRTGCGLYYFGARWYDFERGRWVSHEPLGYAGGSNLYQFNFNNPYAWMDPNGLDPEVTGEDVQANNWGTSYNGGPVAALFDNIYQTANSVINDGICAFKSFFGFDGGDRPAAQVAKYAALLAVVGDVSVYKSVGKAGETIYVGITNNISRRSAEHLSTKGIEIEEILSGLTREDARGVEQVLIEKAGLKKNGGPLINKINSIAKDNAKYDESVKRGEEILRKNGRP
jgi:RHS repeat-associated protein